MNHINHIVHAFYQFSQRNRTGALTGIRVLSQWGHLLANTVGALIREGAPIEEGALIREGGAY